jgi:hypothetical protein
MKASHFQVCINGVRLVTIISLLLARHLSYEYVYIASTVVEQCEGNENHKSITFVRNLSCLYCTQTTLHVSAIQPSSGVSYI